MKHGTKIKDREDVNNLLKWIEENCPMIRWAAGQKPTGYDPQDDLGALMFRTGGGLGHDTSPLDTKGGDYKLTTRERFLKKLQIQNAKLELAELPDIEA